MNKKLMAAAVAGALTVPAAAALAQNVQMGGSLTIFYYKHDPENPSTGQKTDLMESSEPELFVRVDEKLGGGTSAWFQCTSSIEGIISGSETDNFWCGRNSAVGLRGDFGNVFFGNWDTPHKLVFNQARGWFGGTNSFTGGSARILLGGSASGVSNGAVPGSFFRRQNKSTNYHSPTWGGFSFNGSISSASEGTGIPESSPLTPRMYSLGLNFSTGPVYVGVGYESHSDYNPTAVAGYTGGTDSNYVVVVGLRFGGFNGRLAYTKSEYESNTAAASQTLEVDGWGLFADWNIQGPHTLRFQYADGGESSGTATSGIGVYRAPATSGCGRTSNLSCASGTGAKVYSIFYSYALSKRTEASIGYTAMANDDKGVFTLGKVNSTAGNTQSSTGFVLKHRF